MHSSPTRGGRPLREVFFALAVASLAVAAAACDGVDSPVAPLPRVPAGDTITGLLAVRLAPAAGADALVLVLDDAVDRLVPALGDAPDAATLRGAVSGLRAELARDAAAADDTGLDAALVVARAALERIPRGEATAPELDAIALALDAAQSRAATR